MPRVKTPVNQNVCRYRSTFGQRGFSTAKFFSGTVSISPPGERFMIQVTTSWLGEIEDRAQLTAEWDAMT